MHLGLSLGTAKPVKEKITPDKISDLAFWLDASDSTTVSSSGGIVDQWDDKSGNANHATQTTSTNRPKYGEYKLNVSTPIATKSIPDATQGSDTGKGFTCTGLSYDSSSDTFYVGNIAKATPSASSGTPQIVNLSKDGSTIIGQISLGGSHQLQGLSYNTDSDFHIYAVPANNQLYKINKDGTGNAAILTSTQLSNIGISALQAVAYDTVRSQYWLGQGKEVKRVTTGGTEARTYDLDIHADIDHFYHDPVNDELWITYGTSGGWGFVVVIDCDTSIPTGDAVFVKSYQLNNAYAIEGIALADGNMYIANDGYYHNADIADAADQVNNLQTYTTSQVGSDAMLFDGVDNYFDLPNIAYGATTIFVVYLPYFSGGSGGLIMNQGTSGQRFYVRNQSLQIGTEDNAIASPSFGQALIQVAKVSGAGSATSGISINGGAFQETSVTRTGISSNVNVGRSPYGSEYYSGLYSEAICYDRELSSTETLQVINYLADKYKLAKS